MIRLARADEKELVCLMMADYVMRTPYAKVMPDPMQHAGLLFDASHGTGSCLVDEVNGEVVGAIVILCSDYMGARLAKRWAGITKAARGARPG